MKNVAHSAEPLDALIDGMSNRSREYDDLDYLLRDVLRREDAVAPEPRRGFAALRRRLMRELQPLRMPWSLASPDWPSSYMSVSYWYFEPLSRVMR
jgi:hypothetical protein